MCKIYSLAAVTTLTLLAGCSAASSPGAAGGASPGTATATADSLSGMTADGIASKAVTDLKAAKSVHVAGQVSDSGQTIKLSLTMTRTRCAGVMSVAGSGSFKIIVIGKNVWLHPDNKFWRSAGGASPAVLAIVEGKWLKTTLSHGGLADFAALCSPDKLAGGMFSGPAAGLVKGKTAAVNGEPAIQLKDTGDHGTAFVSATGTPELLRLDSGDGQARLDFTGYNAPVHIKAPPAGVTLDGAKYGF